MNKSFTRAATKVLLCGALVASLTGCIEMAIGTAVLGTLAATDRRTFGAQTEDKAIVLKGEARLPTIVGGAGHVNIAAFNRKVLLTGEVRDEEMKATVEREVAAIEGVQSIVNDLAVMPSSSFTSRSNDTLITGKVKASFVDAKDLYANAIKVVTERGEVYLMGRVTEREGQRAANLVSTIGGVSKVVKVFEYITEDDLQQLSRTSDSSQSGQTR